MVDFLECPESASPVLKEGQKSDAAVPVQHVNVCRSPLVDKGALTYFSNFRRREVRYNSVSGLIIDLAICCAIFVTMLWIPVRELGFAEK